jgi:hypothetical protein
MLLRRIINYPINCPRLVHVHQTVRVRSSLPRLLPGQFTGAVRGKRKIARMPTIPRSYQTNIPIHMFFAPRLVQSRRSAAATKRPTSYAR